jgi:hypothetical protein
MSSAELARLAGVGQQTIKRFELVDGIPPSRSATLVAVQTALEDAGVEFVGSVEDAPGIRIREAADR